MLIGRARGERRGEPEVGQPLIVLYLYCSLYHRLSILTLLHPARWTLTLPLSFGLLLDPRQFGPGGAAAILQVSVVHLVLALEALGDGQHVLIFPPLHANIVERVLQQPHLFPRRLVLLAPDFLPQRLHALLADVERLYEEDDAVLKLLDVALQFPVFLVRLSQQQLELEAFVGLVLALYLCALGGVLVGAGVVLQGKPVFLLRVGPLLPPVLDLLLSADPLLVGSQQLPIQVVELLLQQHLGLARLAVDP